MVFQGEQSPAQQPGASSQQSVSQSSREGGPAGGGASEPSQTSQNNEAESKKRKQPDPDSATPAARGASFVYIMYNLGLRVAYSNSGQFGFIYMFTFGSVCKRYCFGFLFLVS